MTSSLHFNLTDRWTGTGIDKVHGTAVPAPSLVSAFARLSLSLWSRSMDSIATAVKIPERDGPSISCPNLWQSSEDGGHGDGQNVHNLLSQKGLADQF